MVNWLPLLQDIIAPNWSAFILGRIITDSDFISFECIDSIQIITDGKGKLCAYKLDLAKAYDSLDWKYLEETLHNLGFARQWIS